MQFIAGMSIVLCVLAYDVSGQTPGPKFVVTGRVMFSDGEPVGNIDVSLSTDGQQWNIGPAVTSSDGSFRIDDIPAAKYFLLTGSLTQPSRIWGQSLIVDRSFEASTIEVGPGIPNANVLVLIDRPAKILGMVTDINGDPIPDVGLYALRRTWAFGWPYFATVWQGGSDDEGIFRLPNLTKGRYRICGTYAHAQLPIGVAELGDLTTVKAIRNVEVVDCPSTGPLLEISPGQELAVNLKTRRVKGVQVSVRLVGMLAGEFPEVEFHPKFEIKETRTLFGEHMFRASRFRGEIAIADAIPPGNYWLQATTYGHTRSGRMPVTITANGPNVFTLNLGSPPVVSLDISGPPGFDRNEISLGFHDADDPSAPLIDPNTRLFYGAPTDPARITAAFPGRYWLATRTTLCPVSAQAGGVDLLARPLELSAGGTTTVHLKFDRNCAAINVRVKSGAKAAPDARVAILISGSPQAPGDVLVVNADDKGESKFTGIKPGGYWLWAWTPDDEIAGRVESLAAMASRGQFVRVAAAETKFVTLPLLQITSSPGK